MEPVVERPALPLDLRGLVQALMAICQQFGQRINRLIRGPVYPLTDAERDLGLTDADIDDRYPSAQLLRYGENKVPGTTDMEGAITVADSVGAVNLGGETALIGSAFQFTNDPQPFSGTLNGNQIGLAKTNGDFIGQRVYGVGSQVTLFDTADDSLRRYVLNDLTSASRCFLCKPSLGTSGNQAQNHLVALNRGVGSATTTAVIYSFDGDNQWGIVLGNLAYNAQRSGGGEGVGYALAGAAGSDPNPVNESRGMLFIANASWSTSGDGFHVEDIIPQTQLAFNLIRDTARGVHLVNDAVPFMHNYVGNAVYKHTEEALYAAGTGSNDSINWIANLVDGADATQTKSAALINSRNSKNLNFLANIIANQTLGGVTIQSGGGSTVAYNVFKNIAGPAIAGHTSPGGLGTGTIIESNNKFDNVGSIIDTANAATLRGDKEFVSTELDASVASEDVIFVAQRPGVITHIKRILTSAGGGGSLSGNYTVSIANTATIIDSASVPHTGSQYDVTEFGIADFDTHEFAAGDVIKVASDGAADQSTKFKVQIEFFYYN